MNRAYLSLSEIQSVIASSQPYLEVRKENGFFVVDGDYLLHESMLSVHPSGPIDKFQIRIVLGSKFPMYEPKVFETGERIPRTDDRHINPNGDCCITIWEDWLARTDQKSLVAYINGPLREFFLSQYWFEKTGEWPFGERPHGREGLIEAFSGILGVPNKIEAVKYHLQLLSQDWPKGHWTCPCGSGMKLRHCHKDELAKLHSKIPKWLAKRMLGRLG